MDREAVPGAPGVAVIAGMLDLLPQALGLIDAAGRFLHANPRCGELLRRLQGDIVGTRLDELVAEEPARVEEVLGRWRGSGAWRPGGLTLMGADGSSLQLQCRGARLPGEGLVLVEAVERDEAVADFTSLNREVEVNNLRRMEARLQSSLADLEAANRRLEAVNAELDRYASMVAHDIRTPFNAIARFTDLLVEDHGDTLPEDGSEMLAAIGRLAQRGQDVTEALLSLARVGDPETVPGGTDTAEVAARVERDLDVLIEESGARLSIGRLPATALQPVHLERVLTNLLTNALKFASPDRRPEVTLEGRREGDVVHFTVADNGVGVTEDEREQIFEPLVRGAAGVGVPGSGVGLATCRRIVEAYGGTIEVLETSGVGTTVGFTLPAADPPAAGRG